MQYNNLQFAKALRTNQTDAELKMWQALRAGRLMSFKFKRQVPIEHFIVDFVCFECRLILEIDGGHHMTCEKDIFRDATLNKMGFKVFRFWNNDVLQNFDGVLAIVLQNLYVATPLPNPLPQG